MAHRHMHAPWWDRTTKRSWSVFMSLVFFLTIGTPLASRVQAQEPPRGVTDTTPSPAIEGASEAVHGEGVQRLREAERPVGVDTPPPVAGGAPSDGVERIPTRDPVTLPTGPGKSAVTPQAISLPSAEGSIQGMGESFSPVLSSGTATFTVPIALPAGRAGVQPSLALSYGSTNGNGPLGIGWAMEVPFISRQTDRGLPRYIDSGAWQAQEDRFFYNGGQELVPVAETTSIDGGQIPADLAGWQQYRARVEGAFMRFFRNPALTRWIVQSKDGTRFDFGLLPSSELPTDYGDATSALQSENADGTGRIFRWQLVKMSDAHGSTVYYRYQRDANNLYVSDIHYVSPASCGPPGSTPDTRRNCSTPLSQYGRRVAFVYDASRQDVTTTYMTTWRVATRLRVSRIDVSAAQGAPGTRTRVRRYHLTYDPSSYYTLLASVQVEGRPERPRMGGATWDIGDDTVPETADTPGEMLPAMEFTYSQAPATSGSLPGFGGFDATVHSSGASPNHSVDEDRADLFDVNSDGLPDLIVTDPARFRAPDGSPAVGVYFNGFSGSSAAPGRAGDFSSPIPVPMPSSLSGVMTLSNLNVVPMDIDGDGRSDLLHMPRLANYGYFTPTRGGPTTANEVSPARQGWQWSYVPVALPPGETDPRIDLGSDSAHIRVFDVNNDHLVDVVRTTGTLVQTWLNLGWIPARDPATGKPLGDGRFGSATYDGATWHVSTLPIESCLLFEGVPLDFEDPELRLGDMNGDGIQDIVKARRGRIYYWPGRGTGLWGDGSPTCPVGPAAGAGRIIEMSTPPVDSDFDLHGVSLSDVNGDGADDMVQVGYDHISVWLNESGTSWTPRVVLTGTPFTPDYLNRVRFADIDGSGTSDIVWANSTRWQWVDLLGGVRPRLLTGVQNGLGAVTSIAYDSSAHDYLTDLAAAESLPSGAQDRFLWSGIPRACELDPTSPECSRLYSCDAKLPGCAYRSGGSPVISSVVRSVSTSDRFNLVGREEQASESNFHYHQGYYEGIEQEFRGFGAADATSIGDAMFPSSTTRTFFHQGRRASAIATDRIADNPDEALKGREYLTEVFDTATGQYLSSTHAGYVVRRLFAGENGYAVSYAFVGHTDELRYDTVDAATTTTPMTFPGVNYEHAGTSGPADPAPVTQDVIVRHADPGHYAIIQTTIDSVDNAGNLLAQTAHGRVLSEEGGATTEDTITSHMLPERLACGSAGESSCWLWRTHETYIDGPSRLKDTTSSYDPITGDLVSSSQAAAVLGTRYEFGPGTDSSNSYSQSDETLVGSSRYDPWGNALLSCAGANVSSSGASTDACFRLSTIGYDAGYAQFPGTETIYTGASASSTLATSATWDQGLGVLLTATDPNTKTTSVTYDGLGRLTSVTPPPIGTCVSPIPTTHIDYHLTTSPTALPVSYVHAVTELSCASIGANTLEAYSYVDGLGRVRASLATAEYTGEWIQTGIALLSKRGAPVRGYHPSLVVTGAGTPSPMRAVAVDPSVPQTMSAYDAYGRTIASFAEDGAITTTGYHALSTYVCDPDDNTPGNFAEHTCTTIRTDGQGRVIDQTEINVQPGSGAREIYRLFSYYRQDGALVHVARAQTPEGLARPAVTDLASTLSPFVERTFTYDTAGRRIGTTDPDTDSRTPRAGEPTHPTRTSSNATWRYLFSQVGDLVAVRDPRGCGQNFFYDRAGRLVGEDYVPCDEAQPSGETSEDTVSDVYTDVHVTSAPVDAHYSFDAYPPWTHFALLPAGYASTMLGRATGVADRGQRSVVAYDARGNATYTAREMAIIPTELALMDGPPGPVPAPTELAPMPLIREYDETHVYERTAAFDYGNRPLAMTLPKDPDWSGGGAAPTVGGTLTYSPRGLPDTATLTIQTSPTVTATYPIVTRTSYRTDGLVESTTYGDGGSGTLHPMRLPTISTMGYDARLRPIEMETVRAPTSMTDLGAVSVVAHQALHWDPASNLTRISDLRIPSEWPDGERPGDVDIGHDALYRVTSAEYTYHGGAAAPLDTGTDWRTNFATTRPNDPMRQDPAPMVPSTPPDRVMSLVWSYDWLGNMTEWTDDARAFYERELGDHVQNGTDVASGRTSALYGASDVGDSAHGGYVDLAYGEAGNVVAMTVHGRCTATSSGTCSDADHAGCQCAAEQHYQYRWDEVNRLAEARRWDRDGTVPSPTWQLAMRQRYRYDSSNQRSVKETLGDPTSEEPPRRVALYVYAGDCERRGLVVSEGGPATTYAASPLLGTETQYLVGGARVVWEHAGTVDPTVLHRDARVTVPVGDLLGTTSAVLELVSGELTEASTYYPNGARESHTARPGIAPEPEGFTGKEGDEEVGLTYFGERYLVARVGRWASADPLAIHSLQGGVALNSYHYVRGALIGARDRIGLEGPVEALSRLGHAAMDGLNDAGSGVMDGLEYLANQMVKAHEPTDVSRARAFEVHTASQVVEDVACHGSCGGFAAFAARPPPTLAGAIRRTVGGAAGVAYGAVASAAVGGAPAEVRPPDAVELLQAKVREVNDALAADPSIAQQVISDRALASAARSPRMAALVYGNVLERLLARAIDTDPVLRDLWEHASRPGRQTPDFVGRGAAEGRAVDLTTPEGIAAHQARPYGSTLEFVTYDRPPGLGPPRPAVGGAPPAPNPPADVVPAATALGTAGVGNGDRTDEH